MMKVLEDGGGMRDVPQPSELGVGWVVMDYAQDVSVGAEVADIIAKITTHPILPRRAS